MDRIAQYLQTDPPSLAPALARFCQLARPALGAWKLIDGGTYSDDCFERLLAGSTPSSRELQATPLSWLKAIDQALFDTTPPGARRPDTPVFDGEDKHWIVRRALPGNGFNFRKGKIGHFTPFHHVLPATLIDIPTEVRGMPQGTAKACQRILRNQAFRLAVVRFEDDAVEILTKFSATELFRMDGLDSPQVRLKSALDAFTTACDQQVDCLIFPELTFTPEIAHQFAEDLLDATLAGPHHHLPALIVLGSYHEPTQSTEQPDTRNRAILLAQDGSRLMHFDKRSEVLFKFEPDGADWVEALSPCDTPYQLLPLEIGLLGLAICKDLFDGPISELLRSIDLDWLLVPSMSNKLNQHQTKTRQLHNQSGTVSVIANQIMPGGDGDGDYPFGYIQQGADPQPCPNPIEIVDIPLRTEHMAAGRNHLRLVR